MDGNKILKFLGLAHIVTGLDIVLFWIGFYSGIIFPREVLEPLIPNFAGYYAWETSFTVPDLVLAATMTAGGVLLFRDPDHRLARSLLLAASGAAIFLGLLDFTYDLRAGMYSLGHFFSWVLLSVGLYLPPFGVVSIYLLHRAGRE